MQDELNKLYNRWPYHEFLEITPINYTNATETSFKTIYKNSINKVDNSKLTLIFSEKLNLAGSMFCIQEVETACSLKKQRKEINVECRGGNWAD